MSDTPAATKSAEARGLVRYVDPSNPTGPMLDRLPTTLVQSKPKPNRRKKRRTTKKS